MLCDESTSLDCSLIGLRIALVSWRFMVSKQRGLFDVGVEWYWFNSLVWFSTLGLLSLWISELESFWLSTSTSAIWWLDLSHSTVSLLRRWSFKSWRRISLCCLMVTAALFVLTPCSTECLLLYASDNISLDLIGVNIVLSVILLWFTGFSATVFDSSVNFFLCAKMWWRLVLSLVVFTFSFGDGCSINVVCCLYTGEGAFNSAVIGLM